MNKGLKLYKEFLDIIDVPVKSHLLNTNDKPNLERYRVLRTQIETELEELNELKDKMGITDVVKEDFFQLWEEHEALEIIKELFDFDFAIRFGDNQPMIKITNKRNGQYWELPETTEICDLLKEVLL